MLPLLIEFRDAITVSRRLIAAAHQKDATGAYTWAEADRSTVVEAAFLKVFIAWETIEEGLLLNIWWGPHQQQETSYHALCNRGTGHMRPSC